MANNRGHYSTCNQDKIVYKCGGCSKDVCLADLTKYHQILSQDLDKIEKRSSSISRNYSDAKTKFTK
jgi:hypothetical protein